MNRDIESKYLVRTSSDNDLLRRMNALTPEQSVGILPLPEIPSFLEFLQKLVREGNKIVSYQLMPLALTIYPPYYNYSVTVVTPFCAVKNYNFGFFYPLGSLYTN